MSEKYSNFSPVSSIEDTDSHQFECCQRHSAVALIAPYARRMELDTSVITKAIAGDDLSYYIYSDYKKTDHFNLDHAILELNESNAIKLANTSKVILTIHTQHGSDIFVNVEGFEQRLVKSLIAYLTKYGFNSNWEAYSKLYTRLQDKCNRDLTGVGVQLKVSRGLRQKLLSEIDEMDKFVSVIRAALREYQLI